MSAMGLDHSESRMKQRHGFNSPLRYPGGKGMLSNFMKLVLVENCLLDGEYIEVYAGGAGVAWSLLFGEYVRRVHLNDISPGIIAFWKSVINQTEELVRLIHDTPVTLEEWSIQKVVQSKPDNYSSLEHGFSTFFLNRCNRSGIIGGGVIGGKKQDGKWKLDARFNKTDLIRRIERIAGYRDRISLYQCEALDFVLQYVPKFSSKSLVYLDPPYFSKGHGLYENHYVYSDHVKLSFLVCQQVSIPWIVSYDACPDILELYKSYEGIRYDLSYSAQDRYSGSEVMFFSNGLVVPFVSHPAFIKDKEIERAFKVDDIESLIARN